MISFHSAPTFVPSRHQVRPSNRPDRAGLTLAELLVSMTVTALVIGALGVFTKAVMDGADEASKTSTATQAGRVVIARISHKIASSHQVLEPDDTLKKLPEMDQILILWHRDGEPGDSAVGQPNLVELLIYATHKLDHTELLELRPDVDPTLIAPLDDPALMYSWIEKFRSGQDIVQPPAALLTELGGIRFQIDVYPEPQGIGGLVQQNVRIALCVSPADEDPAVFFGSASLRHTVTQ